MLVQACNRVSSPEFHQDLYRTIPNIIFVVNNGIVTPGIRIVSTQNGLPIHDQSAAMVPRPCDSDGPHDSQRSYIGF